MIARSGAGVVGLQEVTARTLGLWRDVFGALGFAACERSLEGASAAAGRRLLGVLTAAREPLRRLGSRAGAPWPERVLCCAVGDIEVVTLRSPIAPAPELAKIRRHEAVAAYLAAYDGHRLVL